MKRLLNIKAVLPLLALLVVVGIPSTARADQVLPGTALGVGGSVVPVVTSLAGPASSLTVLAGGFVSTPFTNAFIGGTARVAVVRESSGFLTFYYQVQSTGGTIINDDINQINMSIFTGFTTSVAVITNGSAILGDGDAFVDGTIGSTEAFRSPGVGSTVNFAFGPGAFLAPSTSRVFSIQTNATNFTSGFFTVANGITVNAPGLAPTSAIPEPASMLLLGAGLAGVAGVVRRKLKTRNLN